MIDFHTHTFLSDGCLGPAEHVRRAQVAGYQVLGFADHSDLGTMEWMLSILVPAAKAETRPGLTVVAGLELTHVQPEQMTEATARARQLGAAVVICHGETIVEPVMPGTNRAAIEAGVDILAHPGLITEEDVQLAAQRGVRLELSAKSGHCLANGHVAMLARKHGAKLIFGSDCHGPTFPDQPHAMAVLRGAGLDGAEIATVLAEAEDLAERVAIFR